jgi:translation initiation factor 4E
MVRLRKTGFAKHVFEDIVLAMVGNQLGDCGEQVCGVVYSARPFHEVVSVWTSDASDREAIAKIRQAVVARTGVPARLHMEYKVHDDSIRKAIGDKGFSSDKLDAE